MKNNMTKKAISVALAVSMLSSPVSVLADTYNTYITDNTANVMENSSSEGGGMAYNISVGRDELATLKEKYADLYETPACAGETEYPGTYPRDEIKPMTDEEIEPIVNALIKTMTFEEKLAVIADPGWGADKVEKGQAMYLPGVPRLGVPVVRQHDGSAGTEAIYPTTNLPVENVLGNTFDTELASDYGAVIGSELVSIGSNYELGTQFDLVRDMRWARAKDTFGEDYYLTSELSTAETAGLQAQGAGAQAKHIGAYATNGDGQLWTVVDEQTLNTAYLYPFEQPAKRANLSEIMTTYTRLNGYYTASNSSLLKDTLRDMWNWKGGVVTDAMSTKEFTTITGIDSEMGKNYNTEAYVLKYMDEGLFTMDDLDAAVSHMLWSFGYAGYLSLVQVDEETGLVYEDSRRCINDDGSIHYNMSGTDVSEGGTKAVIELVDSWEEDSTTGTLYDDDNETALQVAEEGIVLLKNEDDTLPLTSESYTNGNKVAIVGMAESIVPGTGSERSHGFLDYMTTPFEAVKANAGADAAIEEYVYDDDFGTLIPTDVVYTSEDATENGWIMNGEVSTDEINYLTTYEANKNAVANQADGKAFENGTSNTWTGYIKAPETGDYSLFIGSMGGTATVTISSLDGSIVGSYQEEIAGPYPGAPTTKGDVVEAASLSASSSNSSLPTDGITHDGVVTSEVNPSLVAGQMYKVEVTSSASSDVYDQQVTLSWIVPSQNEEATEAAAVKAAGEEGTTIVYILRIGPTGHGVTITDEDLYMYDDDLARLQAIQEAAKAAGNKVVVVTYNRTAFAFDGDWADDTDAILTAFYPGQSGQQAIANILTGATNPSGKLCVTLPKSYKDTLLYYDPDWDMDGDGEYDEGESYADYLAFQRFGKGAMNFKNIANEYVAVYNEGLNFGYRWYDSQDTEVEYAFGSGLSYTTFSYSNPTVTDNGDHTYTVTVDVTNTGDVAGDDVAQVYIKDDVEVPETVQVAEKQLVAFTRVRDVQPGETKTAVMTISKDMVSYWDATMELTERADGTKDKRVVADGTRTLLIGDASDALTLSTTVTIDPAEVDLTGIDNAIAAAAGSTDEGVAAAVEVAQLFKETAEGKTEDEAQKDANAIANALEDIVAGEDTAEAYKTITIYAAKIAKANAEEAAAVKAAAKVVKTKLAAIRFMTTRASVKKIVTSKTAMVVRLNKVDSAKRYLVKVSANASFKNAKTVKSTKTTVLVKGLKKNTKYYVKVKAYATIGGKTIKSLYSKVKTAKTK